ncbi:hypothetical protein ERJ75_000097400 [Trypanosoma vivax]|uniref:FHA domain-containing protein n=2 Tax=Trypanosoma vivax (strain Y486) TaxID=1055687 RepID=G0TUK6_TRYVY|nr:hypothetical protein ERJ75_001423800 [Trypanosoma vivax]KAH8607168.1 hypothetical protein ERJ75_001423600 [Trypanosoma vivax]KAH8607304.1 hypothetical protein ERJ75_001423400 [Trypanosoma vivax]KAH8620112.1 hypothetical protein ERJ75_000097400 [Trypanosoma vivax]CCC47640.1 conserved hypothetical protein [Trypanosoma vivax Y486]
MCSAGTWIVERGDGLTFTLSESSGVVILGRDKTLPPPQRLDSRYVSRQHLAFEAGPSSLFVTQLGRNPTFYSAGFHSVPRKGATEKGLVICAQDSSVSSAPHGNARKQSRTAELGSIGPWTLHFPEELGLPQLVLRHVPTRVVDEKASASERRLPSVPLGIPDAGDDDDDDDDESGTAWKGILDAVLLEGHDTAERG